MKDVSKFAGKDRYSVEDLVEILHVLRSPEGCPWDREQDHKSIRRDFLEECYEAIEAIDNADPVLLREELGDVLLQVVFHSTIEDEEGRFNFYDVVSDVAEKMVVRHPHVFADTKADTTEEVLTNWDQIKRETKQQESDRAVLQSVSPAMPALMRAQKVRKKAAKMGEETGSVEELKQTIAETLKSADENNAAAAIGTALFDMTELARKLGTDAEQALFETCRAYIEQFGTDK